MWWVLVDLGQAWSLAVGEGGRVFPPERLGN
jgi:hypothetical protein